MNIEISSSQQNRVEKITRLREYFGSDRPEIYQWSPDDEKLDFKLMTDQEIEKYLTNC